MNDIQRLSFSVTGAYFLYIISYFLFECNYSFIFYCLGPDHITFVLSLYDDVKLKSWNLSIGEPLEGPLWNGRPTYFVYYACANDIIPWNFWIDLEVITITFLNHFSR